jgi:hypothetical protein
MAEIAPHRFYDEEFGKNFPSTFRGKIGCGFPQATDMIFIRAECLYSILPDELSCQNLL